MQRLQVERVVQGRMSPAGLQGAQLQGWLGRAVTGGRQEFIVLPEGHREVESGIEVTERVELGTESCHDQPRMALSLGGKVGVKVTGPSALLWAFIKSRAVTCGFTCTSEDNEGKRRG